MRPREYRPMAARTHKGAYFSFYQRVPEVVEA
jgi:hypothetical protein